jgi:hypothetical protein
VAVLSLRNVGAGSRLKAIPIELLAGLAIASGSLASPSAPPVAGTAHQPYDLASADDRKLLHYDRTHPDCDLWTDWRKLCSRMGPYGETTCRTDPYHSAKPSEPFCADDKIPHRDSLAEALSRSRYCVKFDDTLQSEPIGAHYCALYQVDRPFNGARIAQLETPDCLAWNSPPVTCVTGAGDTDGTPSCSSPSIRKLRREVPYACTKWSPTIRCRHPVGGIGQEHPDNGVDLLFDVRILQDGRPVWGVYCATYGLTK